MSHTPSNLKEDTILYLNMDTKIRCIRLRLILVYPQKKNIILG